MTEQKKQPGQCDNNENCKRRGTGKGKRDGDGPRKGTGGNRRNSSGKTESNPGAN